MCTKNLWCTTVYPLFQWLITSPNAIMKKKKWKKNIRCCHTWSICVWAHLWLWTWQWLWDMQKQKMTFSLPAQQMAQSLVAILFYTVDTVVSSSEKWQSGLWIFLYVLKMSQTGVTPTFCKELSLRGKCKNKNYYSVYMFVCLPVSALSLALSRMLSIISFLHSVPFAIQL